jgi:hypothetical protein
MKILRVKYLFQLDKSKIEKETIPSLSGKFGIPARLTLNPKMPKEPSSPSHSRIQTYLTDNINRPAYNTQYT